MSVQKIGGVTYHGTPEEIRKQLETKYKSIWQDSGEGFEYGAGTYDIDQTRVVFVKNANKEPRYFLELRAKNMHTYFLLNTKSIRTTEVDELMRQYMSPATIQHKRKYGGVTSGNESKTCIQLAKTKKGMKIKFIQSKPDCEFPDLKTLGCTTLDQLIMLILALVQKTNHKGNVILDDDMVKNGTPVWTYRVFKGKSPSKYNDYGFEFAYGNKRKVKAVVEKLQKEFVKMEKFGHLNLKKITKITDQYKDVSQNMVLKDYKRILRKLQAQCRAKNKK